MTECFALLDDSCADESNPRSRLYTKLVETIDIASAEDLPALLDRMQRGLRRGLHAVGLFAYELGAQLHGIDHAHCDWPLAQVLLFDQCERLTADDVDHWLAAHDDSESPAGIAALHANVSCDEFCEAIEKIRNYIIAGDTYQVNYTYRLQGDVFGSPIALYRRLRERQPVPFGALIALPDGRAVVSLSPELFLRHQDGTLTAQPMKGTAPASGDAKENALRAQALFADEKNRAENLMIVDLLRNDLGRVAECGTVRVPALHEVQRFGDVLQMTSTVTGQLREGMGLVEFFRAVYPCGSITGAPKRRAMQIIREIEPDARGLYTGAIGWFDAASDHVVPNFCLSVPIRTLALQTPNEGGVRRGELGVGAGIVFDSVVTEEYAECSLKARFLSALPQSFELFETIRATRAGCPLLDRHLDRLRGSARYFGFSFEEPAIRAVIRQRCETLPDGDHRLRLSLGHDGVAVRTAPLRSLGEPVRVLLSNACMQSDDLFLRHKTTVRERYDAAWREAEAQGAFDMLFCNERGELTEGGRSNVLVKLNGTWCTPSLKSGLLPGVMRGVLMEDPRWQVQERRLTLDDLRQAEAVAVCNALRGVLTAHVVSSEPFRDGA